MLQEDPVENKGMVMLGKLSDYIEPLLTIKDWKVASLIHGIRERLVTSQAQEYDENILAFFADRQEEGLPFPQAFSHEPNQIIQIKNFSNALYRAEESFKTLENLHSQELQPMLLLTLWEDITRAYDTTKLLLELSSELETTFRSELIALQSCLGMVCTKLSAYSSNFTNYESLSSDAGTIIGRTINQMNTVGTPDDSDLFTYMGAIFPMFPTYIETARVNIEKVVASNPDRVPRVNLEKMEKLLEKGAKLSETIKNSNQNVVSLVFNLFSLIRQINSLWSEIYQEGLDLSDTTQALVCELLATIKYEILPNLFAGTDKLELQLMVKRDRPLLSTPLMEQVKPWYDTLNQYTKMTVAFDKKGEKLLKLEDARFTKLRLEPRRQEIETWTLELHQLDQVKPVLTILTALKSLEDESLDPLESTEYVAEKYAQAKIDLNLHFESLKPYLQQLGIEQEFKHQLSTETATYLGYWSDWWEKSRNNPSISNLQYFINKLTIHFQNIKADCEFKIQRNQNLINFVEEKAHTVLFPYNESTNILSIPKEEIPLNLTSNDTWNLYRKYENKFIDLEYAEKNCEVLFNSLQSYQNQDGVIDFRPDYKPCLLQDNTSLTPGNFYVQIDGTALKYAVLEPENTKGCNLYLMPLNEAKNAGYKGYVWNGEQLSYIAHNSQIQHPLIFTSPSSLRLLISYRIKKSNHELRNTIFLTPQNIRACITAFGAHQPGSIQTGTISCSEVDCTLSQITSISQLQPWLPRLFAEALERGHIRDDTRSQCIKSYSAIQPYLISAFRNNPIKNILAFDKSVVHAFSGQFYKGTAHPSLSLTDFQLKLPELKRVLAEQKALLKARRDTLFSQIENRRIVVDPPLNSTIRHKEFSPDVAEFMYSVNPILRQIHDSNKTLFTIKLALQHLNDDPLKTHLEQIMHYEEEQIKSNSLIIESVNEKNKLALIPYGQLIRQYDISEVSAFMNLSAINEAYPMDTSGQQQPNELRIKIIDKQLHYQFFHYGKLITGNSDLSTLPPDLADTLELIDENIIISKETLFDILQFAYGEREKQITAPRERSPDEALDLYLWYRNKIDELADANNSFREWLSCLKQYVSVKEPNKTKFKSRAEKLFPLIQPYLKKACNDDLKIERISTVEKACQFFAKDQKSKITFFTEFFETQMKDLKQKIIDYKREAEKKPFIQEDYQLAPTNLITTEARSHYLIKHTRCSQQINQLKLQLNNCYQNLNKAFQEELIEAAEGVPYPQINEPLQLAKHLSLIGETLSNPVSEAGKSLANKAGKAMIEWLWPAQTTSIKPLFPKKNIPHQVLVYMRLKNTMYILEQILLEMEKINDKQWRVPYVLHLVTSYVYLQDMLPLIEGLMPDQNLATALQKAIPMTGGKVLDPHLAAMYRSAASTIKSVMNTLLNEGQYYSDENASKTNNTVASKLISVLKIFPERISSSTETEFHKKFPGLKNSAEIATKKIETIITHYNSSYLLLFFDTLMAGFLVRELQNDITRLLQQTHLAVRDNLVEINTKITNIVLAADAWEARLGLDGVISIPIKMIFEEFYQGLITPLLPLVDDQVLLLCNTWLIEQRLDAAQSRRKAAEIDNRAHEIALKSIQTLLNACTEPNIGFEQLNQTFQSSLPVLKKALNGSDLYVMSFDEAKKAGHHDCFVWNKQHSQLFYIDSNGASNYPAGLKLYLMSIPAGNNLPAQLEHKLTVSTPMLNRHKCGLLWMPQENLNNINLDNLKAVLKNAPSSQYIFVDNGLIYYDKAVGTFEKIPLAKNKIEEFKKVFPGYKKMDRLSAKALTSITSISNHTQPEYAITVKKPTLIQHGDNYLIYTNTDETRKKWHYVALDCDIISKMNLDFTKTKQLDINEKYQEMYDEIALKTGLTYPIQLKNTYKFIEFIKRNPVSTARLYLSEQDIAQLITSNSNFSSYKMGVSILDEKDLTNINAFVATAGNKSALERLVTRIKAYYEGLGATSKLDIKTAEIQLEALKTEKGKQAELNKEKRKELYIAHFNTKAAKLCHEKVPLHEYTLHLLDKNTQIKPNRLYVSIKGTQLHYKVINPKGVLRSSSFELSAINCDLKKLVSANELQSFLPVILQQTAKKGDGHTRAHSLATEYRNKLKETMLSRSTEIITDALTSAGSIDKSLKVIQEKFAAEHMKTYQQLDAIDQAVDDMRIYLSSAKSQWSTQHALFESERTIQRKKEILYNISQLAARQEIPVATRIKNIKSELSTDGVLEGLLQYEQYNRTWFATLVQTVFGLFEAAGLYTPNVVKRVDKLLTALEAQSGTPPKKPQTFRFFTESTRESFKSRIDALKFPDEHNAQIDNTSKGKPR